MIQGIGAYSPAQHFAAGVFTQSLVNSDTVFFSHFKLAHLKIIVLDRK